MNTTPPPLPSAPAVNPELAAAPVVETTAVEVTMAGEAPAPEKKSNFGETVAAGIRKAAADAKEAAETVLPKIKHVAERAAYGASYAASYGTVFAATLAKEVLPESVKKGLSEGAAKAQHDAAPRTTEASVSTPPAGEVAPA